MICANAVSTPDGLVLVLDPTATNLGTCQYVVQTGAEAVNGSLMSLSPEDATQLSWMVVAVWAICWAVKQAIYLMKESNHVENDQ